MAQHILADAVVVIHLAFIVFAVAGGLLALRWRRAAFVHLPAAAWAVYVEFTGRICPLTPLENRLRRAAGESGYSGGFVDHYVASAVYPDGLTHTAQLVMGALIVLVNAGIYTLVWRRRNRG